jgi:fluoroacetyl-CoA thioesterase
VEIDMKVGSMNEAVVVVTEKNTALAMGSGTLPVYATPAMGALMEKAAADMTEAALPEGWTSVGIRMDIQHTASTPIGIKVRAEAELTAVEGRKLVFRVAAFDKTEKIGSGIHERFAVQKEKFLDKALAKK